jgi:hypothetical protein
LLNWMREPAKVAGIPKIKLGLIEMCNYLAKTITCDLMYEVGSFAGEAAEVFACFFKSVHCVDPWIDPCGAPSIEMVEGSFDARSALARNMVKHKGGSEEIAALVPDGSLDFVYLDAGNHSFERTITDLRAWAPKVKPGGLLGGHDYCIPELNAHDTFPGVERAVSEFYGIDRSNPRLLLFPDTSFVVRPA